MVSAGGVGWGVVVVGKRREARGDTRRQRAAGAAWHSREASERARERLDGAGGSAGWRGFGTGGPPGPGPVPRAKPTSFFSSVSSVQMECDGAARAGLSGEERDRAGRGEGPQRYRR
jgi:hypothetical protein